MISINLLSPEKKKKLKEKEFFYILKNVAILVAVFLIINAGILYATKFYLENKLETITEEVNQNTQALPNSQGTSLDATIKEINNDIKFLTTIQQDYVKWPAYLADLTALIPENIRLKQLSLNQESNQIQITGHAPLRDDFLSLKSNLDDSKIISNIDSPISNLIKKEDVDFVITASLVLDNYKLL